MVEKRKRGRPKGSKTRTLKDESGPLWAMVDALMGIREDMRRLVKLAESTTVADSGLGLGRGS